MALAEPRRVPMRVWAALARALDPSAVDEAGLQQLVKANAELFVVDPAGVSFRHEYLADRLQSTASAQSVSAVDTEIVDWLRAHEVEIRHPRGWAESGPVGRYAAHGLAMHASRDGQLPMILDDGVALANIGQRELLDAACATSKHGVATTDTAAGDARHLWLCGVQPKGDQPVWAAWLHLTHTARSRWDVVRGIENSGIHFPWTTCWASWRPPGSIAPELVEHGSVDTLMHVAHGGRPAILAIGPSTDRQAQIRDVSTGSLAASRWKGDIPESLSSHLTVPLGPDKQPLPDAARHA
ncbi:hypothetical protein, partial [Streptomyces sp. NPDC048248]|uniref:hypothetical protein n=1 Tax=Streptomyces sp. NPDC048248 TaxID=3365523 RepID=UPI003718FC7D